MSFLTIPCTMYLWFLIDPRWSNNLETKSQRNESKMYRISYSAQYVGPSSDEVLAGGEPSSVVPESLHGTLGQGRGEASSTNARHRH